MVAGAKKRGVGCGPGHSGSITRQPPNNFLSKLLDPKFQQRPKSY